MFEFIINYYFFKTDIMRTKHLVLLGIVLMQGKEVLKLFSLLCISTPLWPRHTSGLVKWTRLREHRFCLDGVRLWFLGWDCWVVTGWTVRLRIETTSRTIRHNKWNDLRYYINLFSKSKWLDGRSIIWWITPRPRWIIVNNLRRVQWSIKNILNWIE